MAMICWELRGWKPGFKASFVRTAARRSGKFVVLRPLPTEFRIVIFSDVRSEPFLYAQRGFGFYLVGFQAIATGGTPVDSTHPGDRVVVRGCHLIRGHSSATRQQGFVGAVSLSESTLRMP
jgi:hypothetical protein